MRVLITGGTGFIGKELTKSLRARGDTVSIVSRSGEKSGHPEITVLPWSDNAIANAIEQTDAVVHLAGASIADKRWTDERLAEIRRSRIDTGKMLARLIASAKSKPSVYLSGSAIGIYGMRDDGELLDESSREGTDVLANIVHDWEASASDAQTDEARAAGVRVAFARTGLVLGTDGGMLQKMLPAFRLFAGGPIGQGSQYLSWIHQRDCTRALLFLLDNADAHGPFNLTAPSPVTMNEFAQHLGRAMHRPSFFRVPSAVIRVVLGGHLANTVLTGQRALPKKLLAAGFQFEFPELPSALSNLLAMTS